MCLKSIKEKSSINMFRTSYLPLVIFFLFIGVSNTLASQIDTSAQVNRAKKQNRLTTSKVNKKPEVKQVIQPQLKKILQASSKPNVTTPEIKQIKSFVKEDFKDVQIKDGLRNFFDALSKLLSGESQKPVTVLHLGDNHIARDQFSGPLRQMLQSRFGNAGRGMLMPGPVFPFYKADGISFKSTGKWTTATSMSKEGGPFGISGATYTSSDVKSSLQITTTGDPFSWVEVNFLTGPTKGRAIIWVESPKGSHQQIIETKARSFGMRTVRFPSEATSVSIFPEDQRPITLLSWQTGQNRPGVRYVNLGLPNATAQIAQNLDAELVERDLNNIKPDLVVISYGYVESFDNELDMAIYEVHFSQLVQVLKSLLPNTSLMILGPPDAAYMPDYASRNKSRASSQPCRALNSDEIKNYDRLIATSNPKLARWYPPLNLSRLRNIMRRVASKNGAFFWDWSRVMGGTCGIHAWVHNKPKLASDNHRNLTSAGARQSAHRLYSELMTGFDSYRLLARK